MILLLLRLCCNLFYHPLCSVYCKIYYIFNITSTITISCLVENIIALYQSMGISKQKQGYIYNKNSGGQKFVSLSLQPLA